MTEAALMLTAAGLCAVTWWPSAAPQVATDTNVARAEDYNDPSAAMRKSLAADEGLWKRSLRRPLFDPPPPPPPQVVKQELPPIRAKLLGTILEPGNSQAMIWLPSGSVEFRTVGQPLSQEDNEATIVDISSASVKVKRGEELTTLSVEATGR